MALTPETQEFLQGLGPIQKITSFGVWREGMVREGIKIGPDWIQYFPCDVDGWDWGMMCNEARQHVFDRIRLCGDDPALIDFSAGAVLALSADMERGEFMIIHTPRLRYVLKLSGAKGGADAEP